MERTGRGRKDGTLTQEERPSNPPKGVEKTSMTKFRGGIEKEKEEKLPLLCFQFQDFLCAKTKSTIFTKHLDYCFEIRKYKLNLLSNEQKNN